MSWVFLAPLIIGIVAGYLSQKACDEMAELLGLASVINLILSLVLAPWTFLLLILLISRTRLAETHAYSFFIKCYLIKN